MPAPTNFLDSTGDPWKHAYKHKDTVLLFAAKSFAALLSLFVNIYLARTLGASEFGQYSFVISTLAFTSLFFDFGYFASGARLLTVANTDDKKREYFGAMIIIAALLSGLYVILVFIISMLIDDIFKDKIGHILFTISLLCPAMLAPLLIEQLLKSSDRINLLSVWYVINKVLFVIPIFILEVMGLLTPLTASAAYMLAGLAGAVVVLVFIKPRLYDMRNCLAEILLEQRRFGRPLYFGRTAHLASYNSDKILIAYFRDATAVGYYSLAMSFGSVIVMFSQSVAAASFMNFASLKAITKDVQLFNIIGMTFTGILALITGYAVVQWYLGSGYSPVSLILFPALLACVFRGAYQLYNSWLLANGFGYELRRFLLIVAIVNILANLTLIPAAGAFGAAVASILGAATYWLLARHYYYIRQPIMS